MSSKKGSGMTDDAKGYVDITCSDPRKLRPWTQVQFFRTIAAVLADRRKLAAGARGDKTRLGNVIKSAGFWPTSTGLLASVELRRLVDFLEVCSYDWMHTAFQDGFMSNAMWLVSREISKAKRGNALCEDFLVHVRACLLYTSPSPRD